MNDLMIHVERIVRPVRAFEQTRLRMRRELLAHLQAAFDEEKSAGADDRLAFERAAKRLGQPDELTRNLQRSTPILERILMARVPAGRLIEGIERRNARRSPLGKLRMLHGAFVVLGTAFFIVFASVLVGMATRPFNFTVAMAHPVSYLVGSLLINAMAIVLFAVSCLFVLKVVTPTDPHWRRSAARYAGGIVTSIVVMMLLVVRTLAQRWPTTHDWLIAFGVSGGLLIALFAMGQLVAMLRRPYDDWLAIDLTA